MQDLVERLSALLKERSLMMACAESCTGGLLAAAITERPGSSEIFERGFVTYSNDAKQEVLGVAQNILDTYGAVSRVCAEHMAIGTLKNSHADIAVSITGIAGPDGGSAEKPVGLVYLGFALKNGSCDTIEEHFSGSRSDIRTASVTSALQNLIRILEEQS